MSRPASCDHESGPATLAAKSSATRRALFSPIERVFVRTRPGGSSPASRGAPATRGLGADRASPRPAHWPSARPALTSPSCHRSLRASATPQPRAPSGVARCPDARGQRGYPAMSSGDIHETEIRASVSPATIFRSSGWTGGCTACATSGRAAALDSPPTRRASRRASGTAGPRKLDSARGPGSTFSPTRKPSPRPAEAVHLLSLKCLLTQLLNGTGGGALAVGMAGPTSVQCSGATAVGRSTLPPQQRYFWILPALIASSSFAPPLRGMSM